MRTWLSADLTTLGLSFAVCSLLLAVPKVQAQAPQLTEDERNTIEVFRQASRGVVHIPLQEMQMRF